MDMDGNVLHRWSRTYRSVWPNLGVTRKVLKNGRMWRRARLYPDGDLLAVFEGIGLVRLDRDSRLEWAFGENAHHDVDVDHAGRIYVLTRRARMIPEVSTTQPVLEDFVTVLSPRGEPLERVSVLLSLLRSPFAPELEGVGVTGGDVLHTNTLEVLDGSLEADSKVFSRGHVLVSMRNVNLLAILDLTRETAVWVRRGTWRGQHQPVLLPTGTLLLFDNGLGRGESRVLELRPLTGRVVWSYEAVRGEHFFSRCCGSSQRLPNGNTLITETDSGRAFEVTPSGETVWEFRSPYRAGRDRELVASLFEVVRIDPASLEPGWLPEPSAP